MDDVSRTTVYANITRRRRAAAPRVTRASNPSYKSTIAQSKYTYMYTSELWLDYEFDIESEERTN